LRLAVRDKVETPRGFGEIKETADTIALVQLGDEEKVFYLTDLKPVSELEYVMKSLDNLGIELEGKRTQNTELAKSFFERIEKSLGDEEEIKKLKTSFYKKETPKASVPQTPSAVTTPKSPGEIEVNKVKISPNKPPVVSTSIIPPGSKPPVAPTVTKEPTGTPAPQPPTGTISINKPQKTEPINKPEASPYGLKPFQVPKTGNSDIKDFDKEAFDMTKNVPDKPVSKPGALRKIWNNLKGSGSEDVKKKPVNNNVLDLDTGKVSRLDQSREVPSTAHTLTHISLNQNARSDDEKLNYHYKIGNKANAKVSTYPLDAKGKPTFDKHPAMQGKTFLPGEKIKHQGKPYTVHSHINPMPDANGQVDYNKMLIQDENGNKFSVNRANVEHIGTDFSTAKQVQLEDGTKKYHHQLKKGDKIVHKGTAHEVVGPGDKGYLTESDKGELHYTFAKDYDKNFKHNEYDRNKKAVKDDIVEFEHLGTKKQRRVTNDHPDGAIVQINKSDDPILVPHGQYSFTGKRGFMEHPDLKDKKKGKEIDTSQGPMPAESISEKMAASDEFKTGNTLDKFTGADKKSHRKQQINDNHFVHSLGMKGEDGEVKIHSDKNGSISHIENPFIKIHGELHKILGVSPEKGTITMVPYKKGKTPAVNEKTGMHKGQETYNLTDLRESQNMQPIIKENVQKTGEGNLKGKLLSDVAKAHKDSGVTDSNDIGNETNATANNHIALSKKLLEGDEAILKKHQDSKNKITRGDNLFERDDYEPSSLNKNKKYTDILKEELGDDWKNQVSGKVKENIAHEEGIKKIEENNAKNAKSIADRYQKQNTNQLSEKSANYVEYTKKNKPLEMHLGKEGKAAASWSKHHNLPFNFTVVDASDLTASHRPKFDEKGVPKMQEPYEWNKDYPPEMQNRNYHGKDEKAYADRKIIEERVKDFRPSMVINGTEDASTGAPFVDPHGRAINNSRVLASMLLPQEKVEEMRTELLKQLPQYYDNPENLKKAEDIVKTAKVPILARRTKQAYHENPDMYNALAGDFNKSSLTNESAKEKASGIVNSAGQKATNEAFNIIGATPINTNMAAEKVALLKKWSEKNNPKDVTTHYEGGKLTDEAVGFWKKFMAHSYFRDEKASDTIKTLGEEGKNIMSKIGNLHQHLNPLKTSLSGDLHDDIVKYLADKASEKKNLPGQQNFVHKETNVSKALDKIFFDDSISNNDLDEHLKKYADRMRGYDDTKNQASIFATNTPEQEKELVMGKMLSEIKKEVADEESRQKIEARKLKKSFFHIGQYKLEYPEKPKIILLKAK